MQLALHSRFFVSGSHYDMAYANFPLPGEVRHHAALHSAVWLSTDKLNLLQESVRWHRAVAVAVIWTNGLFGSRQDIACPGETCLYVGKRNKNEVELPDKKVTYSSWS